MSRIGLSPFVRLLIGALILVAASPLKGQAPNTQTPISEEATLALLVRTIASVDDEATRNALMSGMLRGLEGRRDVPEPDGWSEIASELSNSPNQGIRAAADRLSQIFGNREASERALATLTDSFSPIEARRSALASLVTQQYEGLAPKMEGLLEDRELRVDVIRAYGAIANESAPHLLLKRFADEDAGVQRAIVETLATRKDYAAALVGAIAEKKVKRDQVPSYVARSLRDLMGRRFTEVYGEVVELKQNTSETIAKYKRLITDDAVQKADAGRGRGVFEKTCGACHLMYGVGGKVGPDLTGSNRANLDYFLLNSVDPSADVPEGYLTQIVQTVDGRILTGVLAEEDGQRIVLKTVDQPRVVIAKDDVEARKVSKKSMMPEGQLDQLSKKDLFDLVKYLRTTAQVEAAK